MKKNEIIRKNEEFEEIIKSNYPFKTEYFNIYIRENKKNINRFGISVTKKTGIAVLRNKIKRRIKDIIDHYNFLEQKYDFIIITKPIIEKLEYNDLKEKMVSNLDKILKEKRK